MLCPECGRSTEVIDTRPRAKETMIHRRRRCTQGHRFNTSEFIGSPSEIKRRLLMETMDNLEKEIRRANGRTRKVQPSREEEDRLLSDSESS